MWGFLSSLTAHPPDQRDWCRNRAWLHTVIRPKAAMFVGRDFRRSWTICNRFGIIAIDIKKDWNKVNRHEGSKSPYLHTHTHTLTHIYTHTHLHSHTYTRIHTYTHTYTLTFTHAYTHTLTHIHIDSIIYLIPRALFFMQFFFLLLGIAWSEDGLSKLHTYT